MKSRLACVLLSIAAVSAAPAAAQVKCTPLPAPATAAADPGAKFSSAVAKAKACADSEAYKLASGPVVAEEIAASVAARCKGFVEEQAKYAIAANLGWTRDEISKDRLDDLGEKAVIAVTQIRAGTCPVTMKAAG